MSVKKILRHVRLMLSTSMKTALALQVQAVTTGVVQVSMLKMECLNAKVL